MISAREHSWSGLLGSVCLLASLLPCGQATALEDVASNATWLGAWAGGLGREIEIQGDYAYYAMGNFLQIFDVSDAADPVALGLAYVRKDIDDIALVGNYACLSSLYDGMFIVDVSDPSAPVQVGSFGGEGFRVRAITAIGTTVILGGTGVSNNGLTFVDVIAPAAPVDLGTIGAGGTVQDLLVVEDYLYVVNGTNLTVFKPYPNTSLPDWTWAASLAFPEVSLAGAYHEGFVYLATRDGVLVSVDVSDPLNPVRAGSVAMDEIGQKVVIRGDLAFVGGADGGLSVIDISKPQDLDLSEYVETVDFGWGIAVKDDFLLSFNAYSKQLKVFEVVSPKIPPREVYAWQQSGGAAIIDVGDGVAWVLNVSSGNLCSLDLSDPARPTLITTTRLPLGLEGVKDFDLVGDMVYIADYSGALGIVDVADPAAPTVLNRFYSSFCDNPYGVMVDHLWDIEVEDSLAYLASGYWGLSIVDVSDPEACTEVGCLDLGGSVRYLDLAGDFVYVSDVENGRLYVVDVSAPQTPSLMGTFTFGDNLLDVQVQDGFAYVAAPNNDGLVIIDVSDPGNPIQVGIFSQDEAATVAVDGDLVYLGAGSNGLRIINVRDKVHPQEVGYFLTEGSGETGLAGGLILFSVPSDGMHVLTGPSAATGVPALGSAAPMALQAAFPNPFNPATTIAFDLPRAAAATLRVYDASGRLVRTLLDGEPALAGRNEILWDGCDQQGRQVASGVYFYRLEADGISEARRMVLVK